MFFRPTKRLAAVALRRDINNTWKVYVDAFENEQSAGQMFFVRYMTEDCQSNAKTYVLFNKRWYVCGSW